MDNAPELSSLTGDKLLNFLVEYAYQRERNIIDLALPIQTAYFIANFEAEFYNGGVCQFISNSSGRFTADTTQSFRRIGANLIAQVIKEAESLNVDEDLDDDILAHLDELDSRLHEIYPSNENGNVGNQLIEYLEKSRANIIL